MLGAAPGSQAWLPGPFGPGPLRLGAQTLWDERSVLLSFPCRTARRKPCRDRNEDDAEVGEHDDVMPAVEDLYRGIGEDGEDADEDNREASENPASSWAEGGQARALLLKVGAAELTSLGFGHARHVRLLLGRIVRNLPLCEPRRCDSRHESLVSGGALRCGPGRDSVLGGLART